MPKMKTNSGALKRFKVLSSGKVRASQSGKRHGMIKRSARSLRNNRGTTILCKTAANVVKKYLPNNL